MFNLDETKTDSSKEEIFHRLMSCPAKPVYVLGRNKYAQGVSRAVKVEAFVDDFTTEKIYLDRPIIRMADLPSKCIVVSCVTDTVPLTALDKLRLIGRGEVIDYFALSRLAPKVFEPVDFCAGNRQDILENVRQYEWVYKQLKDDISRQSFEKLVRFRLTMDLEHMRGFSLAIDRQYFEGFLPLAAGEVFVDGGGYDGKTAMQFANWNPAYLRVHYFEPTPVMMDISRRNLACLRDVSFVQKGLFDSNDRLRFNTDAGPASSLSASGKTEINVVRLDDEVQEPITFLKMDIEGAEHKALQGAAGHIKSETPKMAVCIYHDQRDFWRIPQRVLEINDRYRLYIRHYSESIRETVMFFVPKAN